MVQCIRQTCRMLAGLLLIISCVLVKTHPASALAINENLITQGNLPANTAPGLVIVCQFFQDFGNGCTSDANTSDHLRFRQNLNAQNQVVSVTLTMCSDDNGDLFGNQADSCPVAKSGDKVITENIFGGFSYTPATSTDPGFQPGVDRQQAFTFAGDPEDMPEPAGLGLVLIGLGSLGLYRKVRRSWGSNG